MADRTRLHSMIDELPDERVEQVTQMLWHLLSPPAPRPETERLQERGRDYRERVENEFRKTMKPGCTVGVGGGGNFDFREGQGFGHQSFHYWDGEAPVRQSL